MSDILDEMVAAMQASMKTQRAQQKSEDIIHFIRDNWRLFCKSKGQMQEYVRQLGTPGVPYSVDSLCDMLGVPDNVYFKRAPVKDIGNAVLNFQNTKLYNIYQKCSEAQNERDVCIFVVAGKSSIVITDMPTQFPPDDMICYMPNGGSKNDIQIFRASDASYRLPNLFENDEESYE